VKIAVLVARSLRGSGFATRVSSMLESYVASDHQVDVFHYRRPHEEGLSNSLAASLNRYVAVPMEGGRYRQHVTPLPPLAWHCIRAHGSGAIELGRYDVVQAETSSTWGIARQFPATRRLVVFHDDDSVRLRALGKTGSRGIRRAVAEFSAVKYSRWQRIAMLEADRTWFVSGIECDRLTAMVPRARARVIPNGAGDEFWLVPLLNHSSNAEVLFVGPGFYEANATGLSWFLKEAWPVVRQRVLGAHVRVVGVGWERFPSHPDVSFVGWRESLASEYSAARLVIAPLFAGGGTNIKILEAMAAARPVVTTPLGAEGLPPSIGMRVGADRDVFASEVVRFLTDLRSACKAGAANRSAVDGLRWSSVWREASTDLLDLVGQGTGPR
jgi:glycosyltransferase involved in cell wall biosynthesis